MNRKLQHSMLALSTTAVVFTMLLARRRPGACLAADDHAVSGR